MAQHLYYQAVTLGTDADGKVWTWANLGSEATGQTTPTFSNAPFVIPVPRADRRVEVVSVTTSGFTTQIGAEGDALPITCDFLVINLDVAAVTGPTPSTDFSANAIEALCTPLDVLLEHDLLTPTVVPMASLLHRCMMTRKMVDALSVYYSVSTMKTTPWASAIVPASIWHDPHQAVGGRPSSLSWDASNRSGVYAIAVDTDEDTVHTQMYTITFTSSTAFTVDGQVEGSMGSGNTSTNFTAGNGDFTISSDAWFGTFTDKQKFYFAIYSWYPRIVRLAVAAATAMVLWPRYGRDAGEGSLSTAGGYFKEHVDGMRSLLNPDGKGGERLPSLGARSFETRAIPYDVSWLGVDSTKVRSSNLDETGERGETSGIWNLNRDGEFFYW
jgi:hypothetical protein